MFSQPTPIEFSEETIICAREKETLLTISRFPCQLPVVNAIAFYDFSKEILVDSMTLPVTDESCVRIARNQNGRIELLPDREQSRPHAIREYEQILRSSGITTDRAAMQYLEAIDTLIKAWQPRLQKFEEEKQQELDELKKDFLLQIPLITKERVDVRI